MRARRSMVWMCLVALLASMAVAGVSMSSPEVTVYVDPRVTSAPPGETFDVYVTVSEVVELYLVEINMSFDPLVLEVVDDPATAGLSDIEGINPGEVEPYMENIVLENLDNTAGWLQVVAGRPMGEQWGLSGTVQIAKITFTVKTEGRSALHFSYIEMIDGWNNRIAHATEDGLYANLFHDIAITNVVPSATSASPGEPVNIDVTVKNNGDFTETFNVTVYYDATAIETETDITLGEGADTTLAFTWDTTGVAEATYDIKAESVVDVEDYPDDNTYVIEDGVIITLLPIHDIAVTAVTASPKKVTVGESVTIEVTVINEGDFPETFDVALKYDGNVIETETDVSLDVGATKTLSFTWVTTEVEAGDYTVEAEATLAEEMRPADNTGTDTVTVEEAATPDIFVYALVAIVIVCAAAVVAVYFLKVRKPKPT